MGVAPSEVDYAQFEQTQICGYVSVSRAKLDQFCHDLGIIDCTDPAFRQATTHNVGTGFVLDQA
jgi:hypothetical protein